MKCLPPGANVTAGARGNFDLFDRLHSVDGIDFNRFVKRNRTEIRTAGSVDDDWRVAAVMQHGVAGEHRRARWRGTNPRAFDLEPPRGRAHGLPATSPKRSALLS
jgi:hypothetical protein